VAHLMTPRSASRKHSCSSQRRAPSTRRCRCARRCAPSAETLTNISRPRPLVELRWHGFPAQLLEPALHLPPRCGGVGDHRHQVDHRLGEEPRHGRRSDVLDRSQPPRAESAVDLALERPGRPGPHSVVRREVYLLGRPRGESVVRRHAVTLHHRWIDGQATASRCPSGVASLVSRQDQTASRAAHLPSGADQPEDSVAHSG
jgi:hypothetical protein